MNVRTMPTPYLSNEKNFPSTSMKKKVALSPSIANTIQTDSMTLSMRTNFVVSSVRTKIANIVM